MGLLLQTSNENRSVAVEFRLNLADGSVVHGLNGHGDLEHVIGNDTDLSHMDGLGASLGVAIKDPTILATILHVDSALKHLNESVVINFITLNLGLLSESIGEDRLSLDEGLNNLLRLQVNHTSLLGDDSSEGGLA